MELTSYDDEWDLDVIGGSFDPHYSFSQSTDLIERISLCQSTESAASPHPSSGSPGDTGEEEVRFGIYEKTRMKPSESRMNRSFNVRYWSTPAKSRQSQSPTSDLPIESVRGWGDSPVSSISSRQA